jgi:hypothetical protein
MKGIQGLMGGLFGNKVLLPSDRHRLQAIHRACKAETFINKFADTASNEKALEEFTDLSEYIIDNEIELEDLEREMLLEVQTYVKLATFAGSKADLYEEQLEALIYNRDVHGGNMVGRQSEMAAHLPDKYNKKLPNKGGWLLVSADVPVEEKYKPVKFGIYFAKGVWKESSMAASICKEYRIRIPNSGKRYMVRISVDGKEVHLNNHEYVPVTDIKTILASLGKDYEMVKLGGEANIESNRVHYLESRGIPKEEIYKKLLSSVNTMTYCYFKPTPDAVKYFQNVQDGTDNIFCQFVPPQLKLTLCSK